jgi:hypothetical protein
VSQAYDPSYSVDRDQKADGSRSVPAKNSRDAPLLPSQPTAGQGGMYLSTRLQVSINTRLAVQAGLCIKQDAISKITKSKKDWWLK